MIATREMNATPEMIAIPEMNKTKDLRNEQPEGDGNTPCRVSVTLDIDANALNLTP
jgi:hypothetical protein